MVPPTDECCEMIKPIDVHCACRLVTKKVEEMLSMKNAVYGARHCGIDVPEGMQCGSNKIFRLMIYILICIF